MTASSPEALLGVRADLDLLEKIHDGRERAVYRVLERTTGTRAVLKIAHAGAAEEVMRGMGEEFLLLDRIRHPHLVRATRFLHFPDGARGYLMEDLETERVMGPDAAGWRPRDPEAVRSILGALHCLHAIGYAHLDLKPAQILRGARGIVLADLGLAAAIGSSMPARGTWGFIAPEVLAGRAWDRTADIYGVGCLLVNVWTGETPIGDGEIAEQIRRQRSRPRLMLRDRLPDFPDGLDRAVESLLDPDPSRRPADAARAWESLHTMAGSREGYLERRFLPKPEAIPVVLPPGIEREWDEALQSGASRPWVIEGPAGSGRRRLLRRLRARADVLGAECQEGPQTLRARISLPSGRDRGEVSCRIGRARPGEKVIALGEVGREQAEAALSAYCLPMEGGESGWTIALLQARMEERLGGEDARRRAGRIRRSLAAAQGGTIPRQDLPRLAEAIAAVTPGEAPASRPDDPLIAGGWVRGGTDGRLSPAVPPWDMEALKVLLEDDEIAEAHRRLLHEIDPDPAAAGQHALAAGDEDATLLHLPDAVSLLRERGDVAGAMALLSKGRRLLGAAFPSSWLALHAALALEDGTPALCLPLLRPGTPDLPEEWKVLIRAHLDNRAGRRQEAIDTAAPLMSPPTSGPARRAAAAIVVRALIARGDLAEATRLGLPLLAEFDTDLPAAEKLRLGALLFNALTLQGLYVEDCESVKRVLEDGLTATGVRERFVSAGSLGEDAFRRGDFRRARGLLESAHEAIRHSGDSLQVAGARANLGGVYFESGMLAESEDLNRLALASYEEMRDVVHAAVTRRNLAAILLQAGRWGESLDLARAAREGLEAMGARDEADSALGLEAGLLCDLGLLDASVEALGSCEERLLRSPQPIVQAILLRDWGRIHRLRGEREDARRRFRLSLELAGGVHAADEATRTLQEWAAAEAAWNDLDAARELDGQMPQDSRSLGNGELAVRNDFVHAAVEARMGFPQGTAAVERKLQDAVAMAARSGLRPWTWRCHAALAGLRVRAGEDAPALVSMRAAIDSLRELLDAIGSPALQESFVLLPDPRLFLAWCNRDERGVLESATASADLEVFLR